MLMPLLQLLVNPDIFKSVFPDNFQLTHINLKSDLVTNYWSNCFEDHYLYSMLRQTELRQYLASTAAGSHTVNMKSALG